jgi:hypothetical protein
MKAFMSVSNGNQTLERLLELLYERSTPASRMLAIMLYPLIAALGVMQLLNPGAVQQIAAQTVGVVLLGAVAALLFLTSIFALANFMGGRASAGVEPSASEPLLHATLAIATLDISIGEYLLSDTQRALIIGVLGLSLFGAAIRVLGSAVRPPDRDLRDTNDLRALNRRDRFVRGGVLAVLGAVLFSNAVMSGVDARSPLSAFRSGLPLVLFGVVALLSYGWHTLWLTRAEERLWLR